MPTCIDKEKHLCHRKNLDHDVIHPVIIIHVLIKKNISAIERIRIMA
jgi:hypothetical protein